MRFLPVWFVWAFHVVGVCRLRSTTHNGQISPNANRATCAERSFFFYLYYQFYFSFGLRVYMYTATGVTSVWDTAAVLRHVTQHLEQERGGRKIACWCVYIYLSMRHSVWSTVQMVCGRSCLERQRDMLQRSTRAKIKTLLEAFDMAAHQPNALSESDEPTGSGGAGADGLPAGTTQQAHASVDGDARGEGGGGGAEGGEGGGGGNTCRTAVRKEHAFALMSLAISNGTGKTDKQSGAASGLSDVESDSEGVTLQLRRLQLEVSPAPLPSPTVLSLGHARFLSSMPSHALRLCLSMCGC